MDYPDQTYIKDASDIVAGLTLVSMAVIGFLIILFSSPTAMSFIVSVTGAKVVYAEDPSDGGADGGIGSDGGHGAGCGDSGDGCGSPGGGDG